MRPRPPASCRLTPTSCRSPCARPAWTFAYRYASVPFDLQLAVEEVAPRITVDSLVEARLEPEKLTLDLTAVYTIERAGVFKLELDVPEGFELRSVTGRAVAPASAADVDSFHVEGEKKNHLIVNLARKAMGNVGLHVQLQRDLHEANLLTPTGKPAEIDLPLPQPAKAAIEHSSGRLVVHAPESLQVNPAKAEGLRAVSFQEAMAGIVGVPAAAGTNLRPVLAFMFTQEPVTLRLAAERRKPQVTIHQLLVARIDEGVIKYQATFFYTIQYSGVKSLRIDVPADVTPRLPNTTAGIRLSKIDPPPADVNKDLKMAAWSVAGEGELLGAGQFIFEWEQKLEKLDVGKPLKVNIPRLDPRGVDRADGQIVLAKAETLDFQETENLMGLRPIDPQRELIAPVKLASRAFEFHDAWILPVAITRYELEEIKMTSIDRAVCRMVLTPAGETAVQAVYRIRSVLPRLTVKLPSESSEDLDPFRINGQPVTLQKGKGGRIGRALADRQRRGTVRAGDPLYDEERQHVFAAGVPRRYGHAEGLPVCLRAAHAGRGAHGRIVVREFRVGLGKPGPVGPAGANQRQTHEGLVEWVCEGNPGASGARQEVRHRRHAADLLHATAGPQDRRPAVDGRSLGARRLDLRHRGAGRRRAGADQFRPPRDRRGRVRGGPGVAGRFLAHVVAARHGLAALLGGVSRGAALGGRGDVPHVAIGEGILHGAEHELVDVGRKPQGVGREGRAGGGSRQEISVVAPGAAPAADAPPPPAAGPENPHSAKDGGASHE